MKLSRWIDKHGASSVDVWTDGSFTSGRDGGYAYVIDLRSGDLSARELTMNWRPRSSAYEMELAAASSALQRIVGVSGDPSVPVTLWTDKDDIVDIWRELPFIEASGWRFGRRSESARLLGMWKAMRHAQARLPHAIVRRVDGTETLHRMADAFARFAAWNKASRRMPVSDDPDVEMRYMSSWSKSTQPPSDRTRRSDRLAT